MTDIAQFRTRITPVLGLVDLIHANTISAAAPSSHGSVAATLITDSGGTNNSLRWTSKIVGDEGNDTFINMVRPTAASQALGIVANDADLITVY